MMKELVFATNNPHKIAEVRHRLGDRYAFRSLGEIGCTEEIPETGATLEDNARLKARHVWEHYGQDCFSEDTGLEVCCLDNAPGVDTAHYAGPHRSATDNNDKLLSELGARKDRLARFRTVICLIRGGDERLFEGVCNGRISTFPIGTDGFGYDPIFIPAGGNGMTFGQMSRGEKGKFSHRSRAMDHLQEFLNRQPDVAYPTE